MALRVLGVDSDIEGEVIDAVTADLLGEAGVHDAIQRAAGDFFRVYGAG